MRASRRSIRWVGGVIGLAVIAASCGDSTRSDDGEDGTSGGGSGEAGETARGGTAGSGRSGSSSGGASERGGSSSGGEATGGTDGGEGGNTGGGPGGGAAGDDETGGSTSSGGAGGVGGAGGSGVAGSSGGADSGGAPGGSGGNAPGGAGGFGGAAGAGATGPYVCEPKVANCGVINDFRASSMRSWGSGDFSGGFSVFGTGIQRDASTANLHITGVVAGYGRGFNMWFASCSTLTAYAGITFTLSGTTTDAMTPNAMSFEIQTNTNYPWQPNPSEQKGACTAPTGVSPFEVCTTSSTPIALAASPTYVPWAQMNGGSPTAWSAALSPAEIVGLQWQFPWSEGRQAYQVDVMLDNLRFTGGTGPTTVCPTFVP